jgi:DNA-binding beta-propeller fold protein YncE
MPFDFPQSVFLIRRALLVLLAGLVLASPTWAAHPEVNTQTAISAEDIDSAAYADWVDGAEHAIAPQSTASTTWVGAIWTRQTMPEMHGSTFGESTTPGPRHLRVGFKTPLAVGSVLVYGGGRLSVLKPDAAYPGNLASEADWLPAQRIKNDAVSQDEVSAEELAIWVFPPGTKTRALRFTHDAKASDPKYAGKLQGAIVLADRLVNIAAQAIASASARDEAASVLNNDKAGHNHEWDNGKEGASQRISAEHPEWVQLTWPQAVQFDEIETVNTGFSEAAVQIYVGPKDKHPREAGPADWKTVQHFAKLTSGYPAALCAEAMPLGQPVSTRAVRLLITSPSADRHPHLESREKEGRGVWLGKIMALRSLGDADLKSALAPVQKSDSHPPIAIRFKLPEPGFVTLVIEDSEGKRVRNLVSGQLFPAGDNVAWWDGTDDLGRDRDAARHGLYHIPERPVAPGTYRVRGLFRKQLDLRYEFSIYNAGNPAWSTADTSGGWLTNHTPPRAVAFVPADKTPNGQPMVYIGSAVSEGGAGLAWVNLDGKKLGGRGWIGGNWTAAPSLARDAGKNADPDVFAYVGSAWTSSTSNRDRTHGELRITGLMAKGDKPIIKYPFSPPSAGSEGDNNWIGQLGAIAAHDGVLVASMEKLDKLLFIDARAGKVLGESPVPSPRGLAFDDQGRLLVVSATNVLRFAIDPKSAGKLPSAQTIIHEGLLDPQGITLDATGRIYVSDGGDSQQVKVFSSDGKLLTTIGHPGAPKAGPYDRLHMNHPHGLAIDDRQQLWVAEDDFQPKRVSVWTLDGKLLHTFYGPGRYGGGGSLDPRDKTLFYYDGLQFKLDWATGANEPVAVIDREGQDAISSQFRSAPPQTPIYFDNRQYMTNCYNGNPTGGSDNVAIWIMRDGVAVPVAAVGRLRNWPILLKDEFKSRWPQGVEAGDEKPKNAAIYIWNDLNGDGQVQPDEVTMLKASSGGVTVAPDLSFLVSRVDDKAMRFAPKRFTPQGAPIYDLNAGQTLATGTQAPASSGGDQTLVSSDGWTVLTVAPEPFAREGFGGLKDGKPLWSYPSLWPGLHASHESPVASHPGEVTGTTRLLGDFIKPVKGDAGPLWCINGNMGELYLFTEDGLFVAQLFQDSRVGQPWTMPKAERGMLLNDVTLHDENFFPTITQTSDGNVYLVDGGRTSLVRVDGLDTIRRIPANELKLTLDDLNAAAAWRVQAEAERQAARGTGILTVSMRKQPPVVDGKLNDWAGADWAVIDRRGVAANFNSDSKPYDVTAAVAISGDRLYAAFRTQDGELLKNSGETPNGPFKTGGCLDIMLGTDPAADPKRARPVAGDERLLVTQVKGKTLALLYRAVVPGTREPVPFASPWRTITIDRVEDISAQVQLAMSVEKNEKGKVAKAYYEFSVPRAALYLKPVEGQSIKGDVGILRGNGFQTLQRVYWNNKATAITADVPSEAELTPALWGKFTFKAAE